MKKTVKLLILTGGLAMAPAAYARQDQATAPATPAAPTAPTTPGAATFSDEDIQKFAKAALEINKVQADTTIAAADKQTKMVAIVQGQGLDAQKFNDIAKASQSDPVVQKQVQVAVASIPH